MYGDGAFWVGAELAGLPYKSPNKVADEQPADSVNSAGNSDEPTPPSDFDSPPYDTAASSGDAFAGTSAETPPEIGYGGPTPATEQHEGWQCYLQLAAGRLLSAREVLYPVPIHLLNLIVLDEKRLGEDLPIGLGGGTPYNIVAAAALLEKLAADHPERFAQLREHVQAEEAEVCGGGYLEREDVLLPIESQLWNLLKGQAVSRELLGTDVRVFARKRFGLHPQMSLLLQSAGLTRCLFLTFDDSALPPYHTPVISWPSPDGKQIEAFARKPLPADSAETFFNLANALFKTIREDHVAIIALLHTGNKPSPWYEDWLQLSRFAPVFGQSVCAQVQKKPRPSTKANMSLLILTDFRK